MKCWTVTGYRIGTVSPFGLKNPVKVLIDASVLKEEEISIGSGVRNMAIIMKSADLRQALRKSEIVSLLEFLDSNSAAQLLLKSIKSIGLLDFQGNYETFQTR